MSTILDAPIAAVTVFTDRARITRRAMLKLAAGEHALVIQNAPRSLDPDTIRATGHGVGARIVGVDVVMRHTTETPVADTVALQKQLENLKDQDKQLTDEDVLQTDRLELLITLRNNAGERFARTLASGKATLDNLRPVAHWISEELNLALTRRREITIARRDIARQIRTLEATLSQTRSTTSRQWNDIYVNVENAADTELSLDVMYMVHGAAWEPLYDMRLHESKVSLTYLAQVSQETGEDWPAVDMTLSTARPATSMTIPKLSPWYIDRFVPRPPMGMGVMRAAMPAQPTMVSEDRAVYRTSAVAEAPAAETLFAEVESSGSAVTYRVTRPVAIESDGSMHKTTVMVLELDAKLDYVIVPKIAPEAYLRASIKNSTPVMLLPGKAMVFHDADYVGAINLDRVIAPNEEFETQLGIEDRIKVERELTERSTSKAMLGNTRRITISYKTKLTNNLSTPAHITVSDQLPVSKYEEIKVKLQDAQPKPSEQNDLNVLKWEFDMPAQGKRELSFTFTVDNPRDMQVIGLGDLSVND